MYHPLRVKCGGRVVLPPTDATHFPSRNAASHRPRDMLPKFYVGDVKLAPGEVAPVSYEADMQPGGFQHALRSRVDAHFRDTGRDPRVHPHMFVKTAAILAGYVLCWYSTFFAPLPGLFAQLALAVLLGVFKAEVGVSIMHDANHGAYSASPLLGRLAGATLDACGASSFLWKQQHVAAHHVHTNVDGLDPDIRVGESDPYRATRTQPLHPWHVHQHLYAPLVYCLLAAKNIYNDDFETLRSGKIAGRTIAKLRTADKAQLAAGKAFYFFYWLIAPAVWGRLGWGALLLRWVVSYAATGWTLALMFQVAHVVESVSFPTVDAATRVVASPKGWAAAQLSSTADFAPDSFFWLHFSGGLNHQSIHHLFPGVCHVHYPDIAKIVKRTAAEFGVPYNVYPSFTAALRSHLRHLKAMGEQGKPFEMPSMASLG